MYLREEILYFSNQLTISGFYLPLKLVNEDIVYRDYLGNLSIEFNNILIPLSDVELWSAVANIHQILNCLNIKELEDLQSNQLHPDDLADLNKHIAEYQCPIILQVNAKAEIRKVQLDPIEKPKVLESIDEIDLDLYYNGNNYYY